MITRDTIQRLLEREPGGNPVLSLYLDMSVNSDNKRTHHIFLNQQRAQFPSLSSDRDQHHREPIGEALDRAERWVEENFDESNKGVAVFTEIGGDWLEAVQVPVPLRNRLVIADQPAVSQLYELLTRDRRYGIVLVDRVHMRVLRYHLGVLERILEVEPDVYPSPHDVQKGGTAQKNYQKFKAEEARQVFRTFAQDLSELDRSYIIQHYILLGTEENVSHFREFLPASIQERVLYTGQGEVDGPDSEVLDRLADFFSQQFSQEEQRALEELHDRVRNRYYATAGVRDTLEQLQEGKVGTLLIARDLESAGGQCVKCGFFIAAANSRCPYCGGSLRDVDLIETMVRMAAQQEVDVRFVEAQPMSDLDGVGGLLRF